MIIILLMEVRCYVEVGFGETCYVEEEVKRPMRAEDMDVLELKAREPDAFDGDTW